MPNYPLLLIAECNSTAQFRWGLRFQNAIPQEGLTTSMQSVGNKPQTEGQILTLTDQACSRQSWDNKRVTAVCLVLGGDGFYLVFSLYKLLLRMAQSRWGTTVPEPYGAAGDCPRHLPFRQRYHPVSHVTMQPWRLIPKKMFDSLYPLLRQKSVSEPLSSDGYATC